MAKVKSNCSQAGCDMCTRAKSPGWNSEGFRTYKCNPKKNRHIKIFASDCNKFICQGDDRSECKTCKKGQ